MKQKSYHDNTIRRISEKLIEKNAQLSIVLMSKINLFLLFLHNIVSNHTGENAHFLLH